ncbi:MAG: hypothetical protein JWR89_4530 [Tardiphaga sp.]|jgi:hypothetical protein|uniref:hypothetical protein n=1 Tax=Tardiphaga sp. TaxID=1926292 RepID=UPI0026216A63|nr:hypothetical protein [Tardiphaga sp.]MDB5504628.1 hypothetical protein [Tardiphaga sp.]
MAKDEGKTVKAERDAAAKAVIDNMAKLKAQRLAREALAPPVVVAKKKKSAAATKPGSKSAEKTPALAAWLAGQQSGGRRT